MGGDRTSIYRYQTKYTFDNKKKRVEEEVRGGERRGGR